MSWISDPQAWIALFTLTALEIVLGVDNIIFLTILVGRLPEKNRQLGRVLGLSLAMGTRIVLLLSLVWIIHLTKPLFTIFSKTISWRDIVLIVGGLFLIAKSILEIHHNFEEAKSSANAYAKTSGFVAIILQIAIIDIVFSLDSVITAVGLVNQLSIMILAIVIAVVIMMFAAKTIGDIVDSHPTIKMLALSFLILVGFTLVAEGLDLNIPKGYLYFAMGYAAIVEMLNIKLRRHSSAHKI